MISIAECTSLTTGINCIVQQSMKNDTEFSSQILKETTMSKFSYQRFSGDKLTDRDDVD